jgi:hypothetical protein
MGGPVAPLGGGVGSLKPGVLEQRTDQIGLSRLIVRALLNYATIDQRGRLKISFAVQRVGPREGVGRTLCQKNRQWEYSKHCHDGLFDHSSLHFPDNR